MEWRLYVCPCLRNELAWGLDCPLVHLENLDTRFLEVDYNSSHSMVDRDISASLPAWNPSKIWRCLFRALPLCHHSRMFDNHIVICRETHIRCRTRILSLENAGWWLVLPLQVCPNDVTRTRHRACFITRILEHQYLSRNKIGWRFYRRWENSVSRRWDSVKCDSNKIVAFFFSHKKSSAKHTCCSVKIFWEPAHVRGPSVCCMTRNSKLSNMMHYEKSHNGRTQTPNLAEIEGLRRRINKPHQLLRNSFI